LYIYSCFRLLIFDNYRNYLISQFDRLYKKNNIIFFCISIYLLYFLQLLDIDCFTIFKYIYNYFINNLIYRKYNYIDKFDFLENYQYIQLKTFQLNIIRNSFTASSIVSVNTEKIFLKFNIFLQIFILLNSRSDSKSN